MSETNRGIEPDFTAEQEKNQVMTRVKELAERTPEIFGRELAMARRAIKLAEEELAEDGRVSENSREVLNDYWEEYRPRTEEELKADIDKAVDYVRSELGRMEYLDDTIETVSSVFRLMLERMLTGEKQWIPRHLAEELLKEYGNY